MLLPADRDVALGAPLRLREPRFDIAALELQRLRHELAARLQRCRNVGDVPELTILYLRQLRGPSRRIAIDGDYAEDRLPAIDHASLGQHLLGLLIRGRHLDRVGT